MDGIMILYNKGVGEYEHFLITEDCFDEMHLGKTETIMCQGNGYLCTRGYAEESYPKKTANTFVAGTFNVANENEVTELPNIADCFSMDIEIDGYRFYLTRNNVENYEKTLNLKTGELIRSFRYITEDNAFDFVMRRFVSCDNLHLSAQKIEITPLKKTAKIVITSGIDNRATNSGEMHLIEKEIRFYEKKYIFSHLVTNHSHIDFYINSAHKIFVDGVEDTTIPKPMMARRKISQQFSKQVEAGQNLCLEKFNLYFTSIDKKDLACYKLKESYQELLPVLESGYENLFLASKNALYKKLWEKQKICINSENMFDQVAINYAMYHLLVMTPAHDSRMNIGAKGLSGEGYKGHTFWDTEVFLLPRFIAQEPETAKSLLTYRYLGLEGARKKAKDSGFEGAMFPWEAANPDDGEVTPVYNNMDPLTGEREIVKTGFMEIHITADVAFGVYSYYNFTKDIEFMENCGYEIILDTAIFWSSRLESSNDNSLLHINGIIGPDEYSEDVDDNAYTNYLAKWNMEYALEIYDFLEKENKELLDKLCEKTGFREKMEAIRERSQRIYIPMVGEDLIMDQDRTFRNLKEIDLSKYKNASKVGLILEDYNLETISEFKVSKQADIMVLFLLFGEKWNDEIKKANFDYYESFCLHDSSLSFSTYCILANDIGNTEYSYELFKHACDIDLGQAMNSSDAGVHAASYGGIWQCIVNGFSGVRMIDRRLHINPRLPKEMKSIQFSMYYAGSELEISVGKDSMTVRNKGEKEVEIVLCGTLVKLECRKEINKNYE